MDKIRIQTLGLVLIAAQGVPIMWAETKVEFTAMLGVRWNDDFDFFSCFVCHDWWTFWQLVAQSLGIAFGVLSWGSSTLPSAMN